MASKSLTNIINQLKEVGNESEGFSELTPEEAEELAGGTDVNLGCPQNQSCGPNSGCGGTPK
ncbi:hypothetical protein M0L20_25675 [Spirosoma sp. RP8]|uniref:Bacteriocin n=1 Tax=Spirosoma liriopis TaxID=2937440 RepID=A0ABT0HSY6_9BACT|nr:hypothetical protein [Spirosoma liriopis]MCK8495283.1 hypothetical protein [Spirosoma liriopis]